MAELVIEADVPDEKLNEREIFWIAFFNSMVSNVCNVAESSPAFTSCGCRWKFVDNA